MLLFLITNFQIGGKTLSKSIYPCPKWPQPLRYFVGIIFSIILIITSPILALTAIRYGEIYDFFIESIKEWFCATGVICIVATKDNNWFKNEEQN